MDSGRRSCPGVGDGFHARTSRGPPRGNVAMVLPAASAWQIYAMARFVFFNPYLRKPVYSSLFQLEAAQAARLAFFETAAFFFAMILMFFLVAIPCLRGFRRGLSHPALSPLFALMLLFLCLRTILRMFYPFVCGSPWLHATN